MNELDENALFWVNSNIEKTKNAIQTSISKGQTHYELDDYLKELLEIQEFLNEGIISHKEKEEKDMETENKYSKMSENEAMSECESEIFELVSNLMDAHGRWSGKEVLERVLDGLIENGYFI